MATGSSSINSKKIIPSVTVTHVEEDDASAPPATLIEMPGPSHAATHSASARSSVASSTASFSTSGGIGRKKHRTSCSSSPAKKLIQRNKGAPFSRLRKASASSASPVAAAAATGGRGGEEGGGVAARITSRGGRNLAELAILACAYLLVLLTFPVSLLFCIRTVTEYERAVIFRLGRIQLGGAAPPSAAASSSSSSARRHHQQPARKGGGLQRGESGGPGLLFILPCVDHIRLVDLRTVSFDVPPQEVLTNDSVTVSVDAVVFYRIHNPAIAVSNVQNCDRSTRLLAATTLRNVLGTKSLAEILSERENISATMQAMLDDATDPWGVKVERVEVKDVRLPTQLQRVMAAEAEASREACAQEIAARGEQRASRALKAAADVISKSPFALQLRYLQTMNTIGAENSSTIVFPLPLHLLSEFNQSQVSSRHQRHPRAIQHNTTNELRIE